MPPMPIDAHLFSSPSPIPKKKHFSAFLSRLQSVKLLAWALRSFCWFAGFASCGWCEPLGTGRSLLGSLGFFGVLWAQPGQDVQALQGHVALLGRLCYTCADSQFVVNVQITAFAMATWVLACRACQNMSPLARQYGFCPTNLVHPKGNQVLHPFAALRILQSLDWKAFHRRLGCFTKTLNHPQPKDFTRPTLFFAYHFFFYLAVVICSTILALMISAALLVLCLVLTAE